MSVVRAESVTVRKGGRAILDSVGIAAPAGEVVGLIGPNGAGKTTLMRVLCRLQRPDAGAVFVAGQDVRSLSRRRLARSVRCRLGVHTGTRAGATGVSAPARGRGFGPSRCPARWLVWRNQSPVDTESDESQDVAKRRDEK